MTPRELHTATLLADGRVLVAGGLTPFGGGSEATSACEIYDPATNTWTATGPLHEARFGHAAVLLADGRVLAAGGDPTSLFPLKSAEVYNPATGTWLEAGPMQTRRRSPRLALLPDGQVLVAGGALQSASNCELFNPAIGKWSVTASLIVGRRSYEMTRLDDGRVLIAGGNLETMPGFLRDTEIYDSTSGMWSETGMLNRARDQHEQVLLADGRVLAAGGFVGPPNGPSVTRISEVYDPASNVWMLSHPLTTPRLNFTANLLSDGNVFAAGGFDDGFDVVGSIEEFDPVAGRWHLLSTTLEHPRANHTATTLLDGSVLIAGGFANAKILGEAEIFVTPK